MLNEELRCKELGITSESSALVIENQRRGTHRNSHDDDIRDNQRGGQSLEMRSFVIIVRNLVI
jgi:hypothetical protein